MVEADGHISSRKVKNDTFKIFKFSHVLKKMMESFTMCFEH